jgi:2-polyprenyl-6-methoxyphenol hydroxylase-like FAD-dependent oxidoreductase
MPFKSLVQIITPTDYKKGLAVDLRRLKANPKLRFVWLPAVKVLNVPGVLLIGHQKQDPVVDDFFKKQKITRWFAGSIHRNDADKVELSGSFKKRAVNQLINALHQTDLTDIVDWGDEVDDENETTEEAPSLDSREETTSPGSPPTGKDNPSAPLTGTPPPRRPPPQPPISGNLSGENEPPPSSFKRTPAEKSLRRDSSVGSLFGRHRESDDGQKPPPPRVPPKPSSRPTKPETKGKEPDEDPALALEKAENQLAAARSEAATFAKRIAAGRKLIAGVSKYSDKKYEKLALAADFKRLDQLVSRPEALLGTLGAELDRIQQDLKRAGKAKDGGDSDLANRSMAEARDLSRKVAAAARGLDNITAGVKFIERTVKEAEKLTKRLQAIDLKKVRDLKERVALLDVIRTSGASDEQKELLSQLVLISALPAPKVRTEIAACNSEGAAKTAIEKLRKKTKGSDDAREVFAQCHLLVNDVFRYYGDVASFVATLSAKQVEAFRDIQRTASAEYTLGMVATVERTSQAQNVGLGDDPDAIKPDPKSRGRVIAVVGGGPVGLLAAIESAMKGAKVEVYEARGGDSQKELHNRMNTIKLEDGTLQRFRKVGVWSSVEKKWDDAAHAVPVGALETALLDRARSLSVKFFDGKTVQDAVKLDSGQVELTVEGQKEKSLVDLVVVASGAGFARAGSSGVNAEKLGFEIVKVEARDFAVTGVYDPNTPDKNTAPNSPTGGVGWSYGFNAPEVSYLLAQITEEQFAEFQRDPAKLQAYVRQAAIKQRIGDRDFKKTAKGQELKPAAFPIEVQQAQSMISTKSGAVLVGDSGATPHPSTAKGLNTGSREIDYITSLVEGREGQTEEEALAAYDWETTRATNVMVAAAMTAMATNAKSRCSLTIQRILAKSVLADPSFATVLGLLKRIDAERVVPLGEQCATDDGSDNWAISSRAIKRLREIEKPLAEMFEAVGKTPPPRATDLENQLTPLLA